MKRKWTQKKTGIVSQAGASGDEVVLYRSPDGTVQLDVRLDGETVWLTQEQMSRLFEGEKVSGTFFPTYAQSPTFIEMPGFVAAGRPRSASGGN